MLKYIRIGPYGDTPTMGRPAGAPGLGGYAPAAGDD